MNPRFDTLNDDLEPGENGPDYEQGDWDALVDTVCEVYRKPRNLVISYSHSHGHTTPRNLVAAIWSETHSLENTTIRCKWKAHKNVYHARERISNLMSDKIDGPKIYKVLELLAQRAPWLIERAIAQGLVPNPANPDEKKSENFLAGGLESDTLQAIPTAEPRTTTNPNQ